MRGRRKRAKTKKRTTLEAYTASIPYKDQSLRRWRQVTAAPRAARGASTPKWKGASPHRTGDQSAWLARSSVSANSLRFQSRSHFRSTRPVHWIGWDPM
jgi:hypothetical protein